MTSIEKLLIERDEYTPEEAAEALKEARQRVAEGEAPRDVLEEEFGIEPDYFMDLFA